MKNIDKIIEHSNDRTKKLQDKIKIEQNKLATILSPVKVGQKIELQYNVIDTLPTIVTGEVLGINYNPCYDYAVIDNRTNKHEYIFIIKLKVIESHPKSDDKWYWSQFKQDVVYNFSNDFNSYLTNIKILE